MSAETIVLVALIVVAALFYGFWQATRGVQPPR
jgi:hypothetical protein